MNLKDDQKAVLRILQNFAPDQAAKNVVTRCYVDTSNTYGNRTPAEQKYVLRVFVGSLYDGLAYGNWPWLK